jgi:hypothetical protein
MLKENTYFYYSFIIYMDQNYICEVTARDALTCVILGRRGGGNGPLLHKIT